MNFTNAPVRMSFSPDLQSTVSQMKKVYVSALDILQLLTAS